VFTKYPPGWLTRATEHVAERWNKNADESLRLTAEAILRGWMDGH
jgi:hypothetical protein